MKLFLGLAIAGGTFVSAQQVQVQTVKEKQQIRFGIKAGGNAAAFSDQKLSLNNQKIGFHAGALVNIPLTKEFSIQPEVLYNQLGARNSISSTDITTGSTNIKTKDEYKSTLNYISVPLMLHMKPTENFYIEAGPEFSYFLNGKTSGNRTITTTTTGGTTGGGGAKAGSITVTESHSEDINKDNINKFNLGFGLGLGYNFAHNLGVNARYVNSLTDIAKNRPDDQNIVSNRVFQLGLNYKF